MSFPEAPTPTALARGIRCSDDGLYVLTDDDRRGRFIPWRNVSPRLAAATDDERAEAELSPGGYGIRWAPLDEDVAIGPLLAAADRRG